MMMAFFLFILLFFLTLAMLYLYVIAFASFLPRTEPKERTNPKYHFAVIVPAHNEEKFISNTLTNLKSISYPSELYQIIVIADNCSDDTAKEAISCGVRCLERSEPTKRGKGQALRYAFDILLPEDFQAIIVVDADTVVDYDFLNVINNHLQQGAKVVQTRYGINNPDDNPLSYLFAVGNTIENDLLLRGRENLGLPSMLRGNGMGFLSQVLRDNPWEASSVVEDTEYSLELLRRRVRTYLLPETEVRASMPCNFEQATAQRIRWASGNSRLAKLESVALIAEGIKGKRIDLVEVGWLMLIRSKPLLLILSLTLLALCVFSGTFIAWSLFLFLLLIFYIFLGMIVMGLSFYRFKLALTAPFSLCWLIMISLLGIIGFRSNLWTRTRRS